VCGTVTVAQDNILLASLEAVEPAPWMDSVT
jgi:hypothetical protein